MTGPQHFWSKQMSLDEFVDSTALDVVSELLTNVYDTLDKALADIMVKLDTQSKVFERSVGNITANLNKFHEANKVNEKFVRYDLVL